MKKLDEIEKKDIFKAPEGYFDTLPSIIQSRVAQKEGNWMPTLLTGLKYALPVLALTVTLLWFFKVEPDSNPEDLLASVNSTDIAEYIQSMEINNDDLLDLLDYSTINADSLILQESFVITDEDADLNYLIIEFETDLLP